MSSCHVPCVKDASVGLICLCPANQQEAKTAVKKEAGSGMSYYTGDI